MYIGDVNDFGQKVKHVKRTHIICISIQYACNSKGLCRVLKNM